MEYIAFVTVPIADCLYGPDESHAVRIRPHYGAEVRVISDEGKWSKIEWSGKDAWCLSDELSAIRPPQKTTPFDIRPHLHFASSYSRSMTSPAYGQVEYGPRGGRFVRDKNGFKRYF